MEHTLTTRILLALFTFAFLAFASRSEATETAHLVLKASSGQTFSCTPDASGKFEFKNVPKERTRFCWSGAKSTSPRKQRARGVA